MSEGTFMLAHVLALRANLDAYRTRSFHFRAKTLICK